MFKLNPIRVELLHKLNLYMTNHPELRFCQIVSNAFHAHPSYKKNPEPDINDVYYMSDSDFIEGLSLLEENERKSSRSTES